MSNEYGFDENDVYGQQTQEAPSNAMKALREKAEADSKRIAELSDMVNKLTTEHRISSVGSLFEQRGVSPKVAKFYDGDADAAQVDAWIQENSDVFGFQGAQAVAHQEVDPTPSPAAPPAVSLADQEAFLRMQSMSIDGTPAANNDEVVGALNSAQSMEDLLAAMQRHGWNG